MTKDIICSKINYIKMSAINNIDSSTNLNVWLSGVSSTGTFVKNKNKEYHEDKDRNERRNENG